MTEFEEKYVNKIICGDCLEVMKDWPDNKSNEKYIFLLTTYTT